MNWVKKIGLLALLLCFQTTYNATIVFDLGDVLITSNKYRAMRELGIGNILAYTLWQWQSPLSVQQRLFTLFATINHPCLKPNSEGACYNDSLLPSIMSTWLRGQAPCSLLYALAQKTIATTCQYETEKALFTNIAQFIFDPKKQSESCDLIPEGVALVHACYHQKNSNGTRKHRLIVLSNLNQEVYAYLKQKYAQFFEFFDSIIISGQVGMIKPDPALYQWLLDHEQVDPHDCYFIDDQEENITAAQKFGIKTIHCPAHNHQKVRQHLQLHHIL